MFNQDLKAIVDRALAFKSWLLPEKRERVRGERERGDIVIKNVTVNFFVNSSHGPGEGH